MPWLRYIIKDVQLIRTTKIIRLLHSALDNTVKSNDMKANEITTLDQLADFINSKEDFPLEVYDIIKRNGWIDESHEEWRVCSSDTERIVFNDDAEAMVVPKE